MINIQASQQIRIQILAMQTFAKIRSRTETMDPHFPHVTPGSLSIDMNVIIPVQDIRHPAVAILRMSRVNLINNTLNQVFLIIYWNRLVVKACTVNSQQFGLLCDAQFLFFSVNHLHAVFTGLRVGQIFF